MIEEHPLVSNYEPPLMTINYSCTCGNKLDVEVYTRTFEWQKRFCSYDGKLMWSEFKFNYGEDKP